MNRPSRYISAVVIGAALLAASAVAYAADAPAPSGGQAAFNNNCRTCHSPKAGDNRMGPSLAGIIGQKSGARPGYANYSQALKSAGITWDEATLDRFIENPEAVVPNNNMKPYKGVPDAQVRKTIVEYLKSLAG